MYTLEEIIRLREDRNLIFGSGKILFLTSEKCVSLRHMHVCHFLYIHQLAHAMITKWKMTSLISLLVRILRMRHLDPGFCFIRMSDVFFPSGENGDVEYFEEFPIRLVHQFEGI